MRALAKTLVHGDHKFIKQVPRQGYRLVRLPPPTNLAGLKSRDYCDRFPPCPKFEERKELSDLDQMYQRREGNVLCITGPVGGEGKTQLVRFWIDRKSHSEGEQMPPLFCFSFNGQGGFEATETNSNEFFKRALRRFGLRLPSATQVEYLADRLADEIRKYHAIVYLDGIEGLQRRTSADRASLDSGVKALLKQLAKRGPHFCIVSSRAPIDDLEGTPGMLPLLELHRMQPEEAVGLLKRHGVRAETKEEQDSIRQVAKDWNYHPLSLAMFGSYVYLHCGGDIRRTDSVDLFRKEPGWLYYRPERMLDAHENILRHTPELQLLRVLGLFDRPVNDALVWQLIDPPIPGLTDLLHGVDDDLQRWNRVLTRLSDLNLIAVAKAGVQQTLHCHPLLRQYQKEKLKSKTPEQLIVANRRIFEIFQSMVKKYQPERDEDLFLLCRAVAHGCAAGLHRKAFSVYWNRISRGKERFAADARGLAAEDLKALSAFVGRPSSWIRFSGDLSRHQRARIMSSTAYRLRLLGRLQEAEGVYKAAIAEFKQIPRHQDAAEEARSLAVLLRMQGRLLDSVEMLEDVLKGTHSRLLIAHTLASLGELYHYLDDDRARACFDDAEKMKVSPHRPHLRSTLGYRHCEFLLTVGDADAVLKRTPFLVLDSAKYQQVALRLLCEGRALTMISPPDLPKAEKLLRKAYELTRKAHRDNRVRTTLALAQLMRLQGKSPEAIDLVNDAKEIAASDGMILNELDCEFELLQLESVPKTEQLVRAGDIAEKARTRDYKLLVNKINDFLKESLERPSSLRYQLGSSSR